MSPEAIATPAEVGPASDLYAVAAVGYFLLTGSAVFRGQTLMAVCASHLHDPPEPPSKRLKAPVPEAFEQLILKGLAKKPSLRPASARDFRMALLQCEGVAPWTEQEASTWWQAMGHGLVRKASSARSGMPFATTMAVQTRGR
jgi:serine/threonine-protein kinase